MGLKDILRRARENKNLSQTDVEKISGIKRTALSNYENGVSTPDVEKLKILCEIYEIEPNDLFEWEDTSHKADELTEYLDELHKRPEMKMLFKVAKKATKDDVEKAVKI